MDRHNVIMRKPALHQLADHVRHAACCVEMVHIACAIGIDARDERNSARQFVHIVPIELNPSGPANGGQMDEVIG